MVTGEKEGMRVWLMHRRDGITGLCAAVFFWNYGVQSAGGSHSEAFGDSKRSLAILRRSSVVSLGERMGVETISRT